jgi:hypothetical protein
VCSHHLYANIFVYLNNEIGAALHFRFSWRLKWQRNGPLMNGHDDQRREHLCMYPFGRSDRKHHSNIILLHYFTANFVMIKITFDRSITTGSTAHIPKKNLARHIFIGKSKRKKNSSFACSFWHSLAYIINTHNEKALIEFIENDIEMLCYSKSEP